MEHDLWLVLCEYLTDTVGISNICDDKVAALEHRTPRNRELHGVQGRFVPVEHDQTFGIEPGDLAAQLRPDRTTRAGYKNTGAAEIGRDRVDVGIDHPSTKKVCFGDLSKIGECYIAVEEFLSWWQDPHFQPGRFGELRKISDRLGPGGGNRDDEHR